jgi:methionine aminotransferase
MARYPDLAQRSFVVASFGKLLHATGWKVGYCLAPAYLTHEFRKIHQYIVFSVNSAVQTGIANYLEDENVYLNLPAFFQQKRDHFVKGLSQTKFELLPSFGSYFQLAKYGHLSDESDVEFSLRMTREAGVACIPTSVFYTQGTDHRIIRFCFAKRQETLDNAVNRLIDFKL